MGCRGEGAGDEHRPAPTTERVHGSDRDERESDAAGGKHHLVAGPIRGLGGVEPEDQERRHEGRDCERRVLNPEVNVRSPGQENLATPMLEQADVEGDLRVAVRPCPGQQEAGRARHPEADCGRHRDARCEAHGLAVTGFKARSSRLVPSRSHRRQPRRRSARIWRAAFWPGPPVMPPPGWAPEPHRYSRSSAIR